MPNHLIFLFQIDLTPLDPVGESLWVTQNPDEFVADQFLEPVAVT